jgi:hypothetical protein
LSVNTHPNRKSTESYTAGTSTVTSPTQAASTPFGFQPKSLPIPSPPPSTFTEDTIAYMHTRDLSTNTSHSTNTTTSNSIPPSSPLSQHQSSRSSLLKGPPSLLVHKSAPHDLTKSRPVYHPRAT